MDIGSVILAGGKGSRMGGADKALETGSIDAVIKLVTGDVAAGIRARFNRTVEARKQADASVEAGREFVEAYVDYVHYVENLHVAAGASGAQHSHSAAAASVTQSKK